MEKAEQTRIDEAKKQRASCLAKMHDNEDDIQILVRTWAGFDYNTINNVVPSINVKHEARASPSITHNNYQKQGKNKRKKQKSWHIRDVQEAWQLRLAS